MSRSLRWLLLCLLLTVLMAPMAPLVGAEPSAGAMLQQSNLGLTPLPRSCIGGLPPDAGSQACCLFGYVMLDGAAVGDARVVVTNTSRPGSPSVEVWTALGPDSPQPYFRLGLSGAPLLARPDDTLSIMVEYSSHVSFSSHQVVDGAQQLALVIPRDGPDDYVFDRQIWGQSPDGTFIMNEAAVATDGAGLVYVADWGNSRIQVFQANGGFVRAWGSRGMAPGQMANPSGVVVDRAGVVYVADLGQQAIHRFTTTGEWLSTWRRQGTAPGELGLLTDIAVDDAGFVYVSERRQGGAGRTRVQKFTAEGDFVAEWGAEGSGPGQLLAPGGLAVAGNELFVADSGNNRVLRFSTAGAYLGELRGPGGASLGLSGPADVALGADGSVFISDEQNGRILRLPAGGGVPQDLGGGPIWPNGLALDQQGNLFVGDSPFNRVVRYSSSGNRVGAWGEKGSAPSRLNNPEGLALDSASNLYISDGDTSEVKVFSPGGALLRTVGSPGDANGQLLNPHGVALDSSGNLYVVDTGNHRVQVFNPSGAFLRQWGGLGDGNGQFREPVGVAVDAQDNVYVVDSGSHRLQRFTSQGSFVWARGGPGSGTGNGQFNFPRGVATRADGVVYVADTDNDRIQIISPEGVYLGQFGALGDAPGQFNGPAGLAFDTRGVLHVADFNNYRIQRLSADGSPLGTWGYGGTSLGTFNQPARIAAGPNGRLYVAENVFGRVQVLRPATFTRPVAAIVSVSTARVAPGGAVRLLGMGARSDGPGTVAYEWYLNESPTPFASTAEVQVSAGVLRQGSNTISLRVRAGGELSDLQTTTVILGGDPAAPITWTMLLYLAGDNSDIARALSLDAPGGALARLLAAPAPANVTVVALYDGDGRDDSLRLTLRPGQTPLRERLPEQRMDDPQTLINFVRAGQATAPADAYYLAITNHGNAIDGIAWDQSSGAPNQERLSNAELRQALLAVTADGTRPIDVLHLDACLMGLVETAYQLRGLARQVVVSQSLAWSVFAYDEYRTAAGTARSATALAEAVVGRYSANVTAAGLPYTIAAFNLDVIGDVTLRVDALAQELEAYSLSGVANGTRIVGLRAQTQKLDSGGNLSLTNDDEYIDLDHFAELLVAANLAPGITTRARELRASLALLAPPLAVRSGSGSFGEVEILLGNARGVAIYYPPRPGVKTFARYKNELDFSASTAWDEFLQSSLAALGPVDDDEGLRPVAPLPFPQRERVHLPLVRR